MPLQPESSNLQAMGVSLQAANSREFFATLGEVDKAVARASKNLEKHAGKTKESAKATDVASKALDQFGGIAARIQAKVKSTVDGVSAIVKTFKALPPRVLLAAAAIIGVVAAVAAFIALGVRGGALRGIQESFDRITASVGLASDALLTRLRPAAAETIGDFKLMETVNFALAGSFGKFGQAFGE